MKIYVFWTAIAGPQYASYETSHAAYGSVSPLIFKAGHTEVFLYEPEANQWYRYSRGIRGRLNEEEYPLNEVPKVYRLLLTLEG